MTTTENSRADALTDAVWRLNRDLERGDMGAGTCLVYMADLRTLLAASPASPPAAAPIEAISKLLGEAMDRAAANGADSRSMPDEYVAIAHFTCYPEEYGYAKPAPSQADERAAFEAWLRTDPLENGLTTFRDCEDEAAWRGWQARAAAASETVAEGLDGLAHELWSAAQLALGEGIEDGVRRITTILSRSPAMAAAETRAWETDDGRVSSDMQKQQALRDGGASASSVRPFSIALGRIGAVPAMAAEPAACKGKNCGSLDPRFHSAECFEEYEKTVGLKPAQADARVGLTDEQRATIERAISEVELCCQFSLANELRALLDDDRA